MRRSESPVGIIRKTRQRPSGASRMHQLEGAAGMIVVINQDLVAQVRHAWIADQQHPQRGRRARPPPDSERLGTLLDTVFRASMVAGDGKPVRASIAWLSPSDFQDHEMKHGRHSELMVKLERARPLEPALLTELGRAAQRGSSSLLLEWSAPAPVVWGILCFQRRRCE